MPVKIGVLAKQVIDPEMPMAAFQIDAATKKVVTPPNIPPVVNGFDENAVEAALQIKDSQEATITIISAGASFELLRAKGRPAFRSAYPVFQPGPVGRSFPFGACQPQPCWR